MPSLRRGPRVPTLPDPARATLDLGRRERVLAHARRPDGGWAVATSGALALVGPDDALGLRRPWHEVAEATWDPDEQALEVRWVDDRDGVRVLLAEPVGRLPEVLRERVMSSYVLSQRLAVRGRRGVMVAVRQHSGDGTLFTQVVPDEGISVRRPEVAEQVAALTRDLAEQAGLAPRG